MRAVLAAWLLCLACVPAAAQTVIVYSHVDRTEALQVRHLVQAYDRVSMDVDLEPGVPWRPTLAGWILRARTVIVLWSASAAASAEVAPEWRMALAGSARVMPILLDATPLPPALAERQAVDWAALRACAMLPPCPCPSIARTMAPQ